MAIHLYVEDVDSVFSTALAAGAEQLMAPEEMFWGDRYGKLRDPFGLMVAGHPHSGPDFRRNTEGRPSRLLHGIADQKCQCQCQSGGEDSRSQLSSSCLNSFHPYWH